MKIKFKDGDCPLNQLDAPSLSVCMYCKHGMELSREDVDCVAKMNNKCKQPMP